MTDSSVELPGDPQSDTGTLPTKSSLVGRTPRAGSVPKKVPSTRAAGSKTTDGVLDLEKRTSQLLASFEAYLRDERGLAARTVLFYTDDTRRFAAWLRAQRPARFLGQPDTITHLLARRYLSECARNSDVRTVRRRLTGLRALWRWLLQSERATRNPLVAIEMPTTPRVPDPVPHAAVIAAFLESVPLNPKDPLALRDRAMLEVFYATGVTAGEMASLSLNDWDQRERNLQVGRGTKQARTVPLGREAERALRHYVERGRALLQERAREAGVVAEVLWLSERGLPLSNVMMYQAVKRRAQEAGITGMSPHTLRRAYAVHLLRAGASPFHVVRLLGCRTPSALTSYLEEAQVPEVEASKVKSPRARAPKLLEERMPE